MSGEIVVDASLALKWVLEEPYSTEAHELLENCGGGSETNFWHRHFFFMKLPTLSPNESSAIN